SAQEFGSTNPRSDAASATPKVVFASNRSVVLRPRQVGRIGVIDANASTRPAPKTLSGTSFVSLVAFPRSRLRTVDRSGAAAVLAGAEQIAPTETPLTGEPPASAWAETLREGVLKLCRS